jgi:hypothetical protein
MATELDFSNLFPKTEDKSELDFSNLFPKTEDKSEQEDAVQKLDQEKEEETNAFVSAGAGVLSGAVKLVEGTIGLGAELIDLGFDTNTAQKIEDIFDSINIFEEVAEDRLIGKITQTLAQIGVPATAGFSIGKKLAKRYLTKAREGKIKSKGKGAKQTLKEINEFNKKEKRRKIIERVAPMGAGAVGAAVGEGIGTDEDIGTLGDMFENEYLSLTSMDRTENLIGRREASRRLLNRLKGGVEGAIVGGAIGTAISKVVGVAKLGTQAMFSDDLGTRLIDKALGYFVRPRGALPQEIADRLTKSQGEKLAAKTVAAFEMDKAELAVRQFANNVAPNVKNDATINKIGDKVYTYLQAPKQQKKEAYKELYNFLVNDSGVSKKIIDQYVPLLKSGRDSVDNMTDEIRTYLTKLEGELSGEQLKQIQNLNNTLAKNSGSYFNIVYESVLKANRPFSRLFSKYKPAQEIKEQAFQFLENKEAGKFLENNKDLLKKLPVELRKRFKGTKKKLPDEQLIDFVFKPGNENYLSRLFTPEDISKFRNDAANQVEELIKGNLKSLDDAPGKGAFGELEIGKGIEESVLIKRTVPKELRPLLGEIRDPVFNIGNTMGKMSQLLSDAKAFDDIYEIGKDKYFFDTAEEAIAAFRLKPNVDPEKLKIRLSKGILPNKLANKYTSPSIRRSFVNRMDEAGPLYKIYKNFLVLPKALSQRAKTLYSPFTHVRNAISAPSFFAMNGNLTLFLTNPNKIPELLQAAGLPFKVGVTRGAFKRQLLKESDVKNYAELQELGLVNTNVIYNEQQEVLMDSLPEFAKGNMDAYLDRAIKPVKGILNNSVKGLKFLNRKVKDLYLAEDDFVKNMSYVAENIKLKSWVGEDKLLKMIKRYENNDPSQLNKLLGRDINPETDLFFNPKTGKIDYEKSISRIIKTTAANVARTTVPNYDKVPQFVKDLSGTPIGVFASFPASILQSGFATIARGIDEVSLGKEIGSLGMQANGYNRIAGAILVGTALPTTFVETMKGIHGYTDEMLDALKEFVPWFSEDNVVAPMGNTKEGKPTYLDISYVFPYDTLIKPAITVLNDVSQGQKDGDSIKQDLFTGIMKGMTKIAEPFVQEAILTEALVDVIIRKGKTARGGEVFEDTDSMQQKLEKSTAHILKTFMPGSIDQIKRLVFSKNDDGEYTGIDDFEFTRPDKSGRIYDLGNEFGGIFGFRRQVVDIGDSAQYKVTKFKKDIKNIENSFVSNSLKETALLGFGIPSPEQIVQNYVREEKNRFRIFKDMSRFVEAGYLLGSDLKDFNKAINRIDDKRVINDLKKAQYEPNRITDFERNAFKKRAKKIAEGYGLPVSDYRQFYENYDKAFDIIKDLYKANNGISLKDGELNFGIYDVLEDQSVTVPPQTQSSDLDFSDLFSSNQETPDTGSGSVVTGQGPTIQGQGSTLGQTDVRFRKGTLTDPTERLIAGVD